MMRYFPKRVSVTFTMVTLLTVLLSVLGGCRQDLALPYKPIQLSTPPAELSLETVYNAYIDDAEEAEAKYKGKRFLFTGLVVDKVESYYLNSKATDISIMVGNVKFKPRYEYDLDHIFPGYVVDITGVPRSLVVNRILLVDDCLIYVMEGSGDIPPPGY